LIIPATKYIAFSRARAKNLNQLRSLPGLRIYRPMPNYDKQSNNPLISDNLITSPARLNNPASADIKALFVYSPTPLESCTKNPCFAMPIL
jgi:hypothetical protein